MGYFDQKFGASLEQIECFVADEDYLVELKWSLGSSENLRGFGFIRERLEWFSRVCNFIDFFLDLGPE